MQEVGQYGQQYQRQDEWSAMQEAGQYGQMPEAVQYGQQCQRQYSTVSNAGGRTVR